MKKKSKDPGAEGAINLSTQLFAAIQKRIVEGKLAPGTRLVERVVCEEFGVSRGIVREAFVHLANSGLIDITPDAGARVSVLTDERVTDAFLFREGVEAIAAEQCAVRMNREQAGRLAQLAGRFAEEYEAFVADRPNQLQQLDMSFHRAIIEGSRNELIQRAWNMSMVHFIRGVRTPPEELTKHARISMIDDHVAIATAIVDGSAEEAGLKMKQHLQHGRKLFLEYKLRQIHLPREGSVFSMP